MLLHSDHGLLVWPLLPFSRGAVKINSTNAFTKPTIRANFFAADIDMHTQIHANRMARKIFRGAPFSAQTTGETIPGNAVSGGLDASDTA